MRMMPMAALIMFYTNGCAVLHSAGVGEIDNRGGSGAALDLKVAETGFDVQGASRMSRDLARNHGNRNARGAFEAIDLVVALTNFAPQAGNPTMSDKWADSITADLVARCQGGTVKNVQFMREMAKYPLVSGEIVRVSAECYQRDGGNK